MRCGDATEKPVFNSADVRKHLKTQPFPLKYRCFDNLFGNPGCRPVALRRGQSLLSSGRSGVNFSIVFTSEMYL